jgi:hypothetical protein
VVAGDRQEVRTAPAAAVPRPTRNFLRDRNKCSGVISDDFIFFTSRGTSLFFVPNI